MSEKTVGNYMNELDIRAIYYNKWIATTMGNDFSNTLVNLLERNFHTTAPILSGVAILPTFGRLKALCI